MKLTIHNYRESQMGLEYHGFRTDLFIDGFLAATVWNDGNGGPNAYQWKGKYADHKGFKPPMDVQAWLDSLPTVPYYGHDLKRDLDCMVDEAVEQHMAKAA